MCVQIRSIYSSAVRTSHKPALPLVFDTAYMLLYVSACSPCMFTFLVVSSDSLFQSIQRDFPQIHRWHQHMKVMEAFLRLVIFYPSSFLYLSSPMSAQPVQLNSCWWG